MAVDNDIHTFDCVHTKRSARSINSRKGKFSWIFLAPKNVFFCILIAHFDKVRMAEQKNYSELIKAISVASRFNVSR